MFSKSCAKIISSSMQKKSFQSERMLQSLLSKTNRIELKLAGGKVNNATLCLILESLEFLSKMSQQIKMKNK